jgi:hypothetical protein
VGQKQQARPGGGSSLVAYGAITVAAVMGSWFFTRIGTYNSVTFAVSVRLLETPLSPQTDRALQNRLEREAHLRHAQRIEPGKCGVNPDQLANRRRRS